MADLSDVENAMIGVIAQALGIGNYYIPGSTVMSSLTGVPCRAYRGWPKSAVLNNDLVQGTTTITVYPVAGATRRTTRYLPQWRDLLPVAASMSSTVVGNKVTFIGSSTTQGQVAAIRLGPPIGGQIYAYRIIQGDTAGGVAAKLGSLIDGAAIEGTSITLSSGIGLSATVAVDRTAYRETRRQAQQIWVTIWSPTPRDRDVVVNAVDDGFANMTDQYDNLTYAIGLPDGSWGDIRYISSHTDDVPQQDNLWRRDLRYSIDYPTTQTQQQPVVTAIGGSLTVSDTDFVVEFGNE